MNIITKKDNNQKNIETINFAELVKNSNTTLTLDYQSKMIDLLTKEFTDEQLQWYIVSLYIYLNYHPTDDFLINLGNIFRMLGFANKGNAMKTIKSNFTIDVDYKISLVHTEKRVHGGQNREDVMLNVDTFKSLCMLVKTEKGAAIRSYYIKMESIHNKVIKMEIDEQKILQENTMKLLKEKQVELDQTQRQLQNKTKLKVKKWYYQEPGHVIYGYASNVNKPDDYILEVTEINKDDESSLITIGKTKNVKMRESNYMTHNQTGDMFYMRKCHNCDLVEKVIHHMLDKYRVENNREWFNLSKKLTIYIVDVVCDFLDKFIDCSEQLPEFKVKEFLSGLNVKPLDTTVIIEPTIVKKLIHKTIKQLYVPNITYNNDLTNYDKFITESCDTGLDEDFSSLPYDLIAAYRLWSKGNLSNKKEFLEYIKSKYVSKDRYIKEYGIRSVMMYGIQPKKLEFPINTDIIPKYQEFCIDKCNVGHSYKIKFSDFINNYIDWLKVNYIDYKYTNDEDIKIKEFFSINFVIQKNHNGVLGIWGMQLKTDILPLNNRDKRKKIYKINIDTKEILDIFDSLTEASHELNISSKEISDNIRFANVFDDNIDNIKILLKHDDYEENTIIFNKRMTLRKVYQIDYDTREILDTFDGIIGASSKLKVSTTTIGKYLKTHKTFTINYKKVFLSYDQNTEDITEQPIIKQLVRQKRFKKIYKIDLETNTLLDTFNGILDASIKLHIGECTVSRYLKSGRTMKITNNNKIKSIVLKYIHLDNL